MKIVKKADGSTVVQMDEKEWKSIGASNGWFRNDPALLEAASNREEVYGDSEEIERKKKIEAMKAVLQQVIYKKDDVEEEE